MHEALGGDLGGDQILVIFAPTEFTEYIFANENHLGYSRFSMHSVSVQSRLFQASFS